jgi:hypothetical protein
MAAFDPNLADDLIRAENVTRWRTGPTISSHSTANTATLLDASNALLRSAEIQLSSIHNEPIIQGWCHARISADGDLLRVDVLCVFC